MLLLFVLRFTLPEGLSWPKLKIIDYGGFEMMSKHLLHPADTHTHARSCHSLPWSLSFVFCLCMCVPLSAAAKAAECRQTERSQSGPDKHQLLCLPSTWHMCSSKPTRRAPCRGQPLCGPTLLISVLTHPIWLKSLFCAPHQLIWPVGLLLAHNRSAIPNLILSIFSTASHFHEHATQREWPVQYQRLWAQTIGPILVPLRPTQTGDTTAEGKHHLSLSGLFQKKGTEKLPDNQFMCLRTRTLFAGSQMWTFPSGCLNSAIDLKTDLNWNISSSCLTNRLFSFRVCCSLVSRLLLMLNFTVKPSHQFCFSTKVLRKQPAQVWVWRCVRGWRNANNKAREETDNSSFYAWDNEATANADHRWIGSSEAQRGRSCGHWKFS